MYFPRFGDKPDYVYPLGGYLKFSYPALWEEGISRDERGISKEYISKVIYDDDDIIEILIMISGSLN